MAVANPQWQNDKRLCLQIEDLAKNTLFKDTTLAIANGDQLSLLDSITISQVAMEMGYRLNGGQESKSGKIAANAYRQRYKEEPSKHMQNVGGGVRPVNSYMERDRDIVEAAIRAVV